MKRYYKNILLAIAAIVAAVGCEKQPQYGELTDTPIMLSATETGTKAMLDNGTFKKKGNQIKIYDYYTPTTGAAGYYIGVDPDEYIKSEGENQATWPFVEKRYNWTPDGVHKFFGWLAEDVNMTSDTDAVANTPAEFFVSGFGFNTTTQVLTIPAKSMQQDTPQFDFMYSDIYERDLTTNPDYATAVPLEFSHLFTAFSVTALNSSSNTIVLKSVTLTDLMDRKSATIDYSAAKGTTVSTPATVAYDNAATSGQSFIFTNTTGLTLTSTAQTFADYNLMWPQTDTELDNASLIVVYDYTDKATSVTTQNVTKTIPLSSLDAWEAGKKNNINLVFKDKEIKLICNVEPWTWEQQVIEFSDQVSIGAGGTMKDKWQNVASVNYDTGEVILKQSTEQEASVKFKIDSPLGATWTASLIMIEGSTDAVQFVEGYKYGKVGEPGEIRLRVSKDSPIENRNSYYLRITVQTADGNTIVVTNGLTGSENYSEFKIIQNLIN